MKLYHKIANDERLIAFLLISLGVLLLFIMLLFVSLRQAQGTQTVYVPPHLETGTTLSVNTPSDEFVYGFTYYIWQVLNNWAQDGGTDYHANIHMLQAYFTPNFYLEIKGEADMLKAKRQSTDRVRRLTGLDGALYKPQHVKKLDNNSWLVTLKMQVNEHFSESHMRIKDVGYEYKLYVTRYDFNREANPWGLVIAGYAANPKRIEEN